MTDRPLVSRRSVLRTGAGLGSALLFGQHPLLARKQSSLNQKVIPSTGERVPVVGLGSWRTFNLEVSSRDARGALEVVRLFHELGGRVIDTAPSYGRSERFVGAAARELGLSDSLFLATKVNVENRGESAARNQMENSSDVLGKDTIELMQVWNLGDNFRSLTDRYLASHMEAVQEWKTRGRARYIGVTTSFPRQYQALETALSRYEMDFVQLDYSIGDREPEERLLPLARDRGIAVLVNRPFTTGNLFSKVAGQALPSWAGDLNIESWAQYFLKFIVSHPAVTCAIPATGDPTHLVDNMGACTGPLPSAAERRRMVESFERL